MFFRFHVLALLLTAASLLAATPSPAADSPSLAEIHTAWKKREDAAKTVQVHWTETQTLAKGAFEGGEVAFPTDDTTFDLKMQVWLDGTKMRFDESGKQWQQNRGFFNFRYWSAWDNVTSRSLHSSSLFRSKTPYAQGYVNARSENYLSGYLHLYIPVWHFRGCDKVIGAERRIAEYDGAIVITKDKIGDDPCVIIRQEYGDVDREIWVDPAQDCAVRRIRDFTLKKTTLELDAVYEKDAKHGWLPKSWTYTSWTLGASAIRRRVRSGTVKITKIEINPKLPASAFAPDFPIGAMVRDQRTNEEWYVKSDGSKRPITREERQLGATYEEIAESESGEAGKNRKPPQ